MRIPHDKVYRAFPEFDPFTDAQCDRFMQRMRVDTPYRLVRTSLVPVIVILVVGITAATINGYDYTFHRWLWLRSSRRLADSITLVSWVAIMPSAVLFAVLISRDSLLRLFLRRATRRRIERIRCLYCKYCLLGQPTLEGSLICPECGTKTNKFLGKA